MFEIDHLDFIGNSAFDELVDYLFGGCPTRRIVDDDGVESTRVYFPRRRRNPDANYDVSPNKQTTSEPTWRKEVREKVDVPEWTQTPSKPIAKPEPKSMLEMLEDGDERLKRLLGDIIDRKLDEREKAKDEPKPLKNDPSVFIANRLTFLIQTMFPIVFDTSCIGTGKDFMTIALNEDKTFPRIGDIDELGYITAQINNSRALADEIDSFLDEDGVYSNIYCFPTTMVNRDGDDVFAIKFVCYSK